MTEIILKGRNRAIKSHKLKKIATFILKRLGYPEGTCLSLLFVDTAFITWLNYKYFKKRKKTNVIAFPMNFASPEQGNLYYIGDVVVCPAVAKEEAKKAGISTDERLIELLIHGILHLAGFTDDTEKNWKRMEKKQISILNEIKAKKFI